MNNKSTSWGSVAPWYADLVDDPTSFQLRVIGPNLLRLMELKKRMRVLDLACGEGWFSRLCAEHGAQVTGVDVATELIDVARSKSLGSFRHPGLTRIRRNENLSDPGQARMTGSSTISFHQSPADHVPMVKSQSMDRVVIVLALQNIDNVAGVLSECARVLAPKGRLLFVLNHPTFRISKHSSWGWDDKEKIQYRRIDQYLSETREEIIMHPGQNNSASTVSFHRPLQCYMKALAKSGFCITRLEEWISPKKSQNGPRGAAEDQARKQFPLFLCIEARQSPSPEPSPHRAREHV